MPDDLLWTVKAALAVLDQPGTVEMCAVFKPYISGEDTFVRTENGEFGLRLTAANGQSAILAFDSIKTLVARCEQAEADLAAARADAAEMRQAEAATRKDCTAAVNWAEQMEQERDAARAEYVKAMDKASAEAARAELAEAEVERLREALVEVSNDPGKYDMEPHVQRAVWAALEEKGE